jgi:hypothetical protein
MDYTKPELILIGQAESLVLGVKLGMGDPGNPISSHVPGSLEFED